MTGIDVAGRQGLSVEDTPYGSVGIVHREGDLDAWWIWKDAEDIEPTPAVMDRDDFLYIVRGALRLELPDRAFVLRAGEAFVIPAGTPFRGYRWPRDGEPCLFLAVAPSGATFTRG